ncbi:histidine kinase [Hymenobacter sp. 5516J-16]|nr:histidine kinase [Hymenobacter sp. 5516J-16]UOQ78573.1 histidine kinase [Hymenobacter sp. 5516J-16]
MERQQLLTELAMLKTQINPHFLFNTLNNIYSLTSRKSDKAPRRCCAWLKLCATCSMRAALIPCP